MLDGQTAFQTDLYIKPSVQLSSFNQEGSLAVERGKYRDAELTKEQRASGVECSPTWDIRIGPSPQGSETTMGKQEASKSPRLERTAVKLFSGCNRATETLEWQLPEQDRANQLPTWMKRGLCQLLVAGSGTVNFL